MSEILETQLYKKLELDSIVVEEYNQGLTKKCKAALPVQKVRQMGVTKKRSQLVDHC